MGGNYEQEPLGGVQRWRFGHHHHHHGPGNTGPRRSQLPGPQATYPATGHLPAQFLSHGHLLGQPPQYHSRFAFGQPQGNLDQHGLALHDLFDSFGHGLGGEEPSGWAALVLVRPGSLIKLSQLLALAALCLADCLRQPGLEREYGDQGLLNLGRQLGDCLVSLCLANFVLGLHGFGHADVVYAGPAGQGVAGKK